MGPVSRSLFTIVLCMLLAPAASALTVFTATLEGAQENPPVVTSASGSATLTLSDAKDRLDIEIQLNRLDLGGQTAGTADDVTLAHIHLGAVGVNGGVVFGFIGPNSDTNGDLVIDPVAGTIVSGWDLAEGLDAQLANLVNQLLYINVHTTANAGGEIRGQVVPEPASALLLGAGLLGLALRRRRCATG